MDHEAMLAYPLAELFRHLAMPLRLGDWLPEVTVVQADAAPPTGLGAEFGLRLRCGDREAPGTGQLIAYEPPWSVAYRLRAGPDTYVLRVTCTSTSAGSRVCVHQADEGHPLAVNLTPLRQVSSPSAAEERSPHPPVAAPSRSPREPGPRSH